MLLEKLIGSISEDFARQSYFAYLKTFYDYFYQNNFFFGI